ncbi:17492_t:CDS:2 [Funneliformis geosporum]|uniref:19174_t:CDS:1 n=1 Tax=Funneliformis geosporum TaxID=1117311 RepID=A0A9W4WTR6_9GLOM|nr:17492_t:CDS:2 [Funneliformis geosporum]CAI2162971.1 19174_t:CDS:2 [Funneliformis geosporum]
MPNMNGYELLRNIRNHRATQSIPVILLSAKAEEGDNIKGLDKGASDYLTKPFSARELIARVRVNIKLSYLRQQLYLHQCHQAETKQLLFSISNKIHSGYDLKETLASAVEEIHNILPSDRLFVVANEQFEGGDDVIVAFSAKDKNETNLEGHTVKYTSEQIKKQSDPKLSGKIVDIGKKGVLCSSCGGNKLEDHFSIANKTLSEIENENKFIKPESQIASIENMVQHSDHKDLEIAIIPKFYSVIVQNHVSLLAVAIIVNNSIWGWIKAHRLPNHNWLDWEKEFLQQISNQISLAITHSKLSEEKLKKDAQMEAAKAANEAKGQILANTSHGAIIGVLSALEETPLTEDQKDMIDIMSRASDVVLSVVNDILDAAKLEAQKIKLMNRAFNLFDLVEKTLELFGERAGTKQIELILDCEPNKLPKFVITDPERFQQVLVNLLSNSIKFTDNGQVILKISISSCGDVIEESSGAKGHEFKGKSKLLVEISDTGIGIEPAFIKVIFDSFSQGDASMTRRHDGTGLGLSICKHLVSINGGELRVQSELGKGSKFWFTWNIEPLAMSVTQTTSIPQISQPLTSSEEPTTLTFPSMIRSKRVLIIDPVENARNSLVKLIRASIDVVDAFDSCEEGINKARQLKAEQNGSPYDLVFLNVYLETAEIVKRAALQLRLICGQGLSIAFLVFWSVKGRALGKVLINQIGGHAAALCKPVMQKKLFDCLYNNSLFKQTDTSDTSEYYMREYNAIRSLVDIRTDKFYYNNRPTSSINEKVQMTIEGVEDDLRSRREDINAMIIDQDCVSKDQKVNVIEQVSNKTSTGKAANVVIGVKRNVSEKNDNNPRAQKSRSRTMPKSKCILCVEDNPINLKVIKHQLSKLGYPTLSATNGQEAINLVEAEYANLPSDHNSSSLDGNLNNSSDTSSRISLILMDCAMPILSGFDASISIRQMQPPASNIPIIALTASAVQGTRDKCLESGMNDFLTKPLRIPELKEMLNKWLGDDE